MNDADVLRALKEVHDPELGINIVLSPVVLRLIRIGRKEN